VNVADIAIVCSSNPCIEALVPKRWIYPHPADL
jgi:hypothetical protein